MASIRKFEELRAWQKARRLQKRIQSIAFGNNFSLKDQIQRAALSIALNIAEGFGRRTDMEFSQFLNQAHGSAAEVQTALYSALDGHYITQAKFEELYREADDLGKMTCSFAKYLRQSGRSRRSDARDG